MNIVKFLDEPLNDNEWFTKYLQGKYAYIVSWKYIVPIIENGTTNDIIYDAEINNSTNRFVELDGCSHMNIDTVKHLIDTSMSEKINDVTDYINLNKIIIPGGPSVNDAKIFRKWLAESMYEVIKDTDETDIKTMLSYYMNNMMDDTIKNLIEFTSPSIMLTHVNPMSCSTCATEYIYSPQASSCNPVQIYKEGIYHFMVNTFSNIEYWNRFGFYKEIIQMLDVIITNNLLLSPTLPFNTYTDCTCVNKQNTSEKILREILLNFKQAMIYFSENKVEENKLFINNALSEWSTYLYEKMYWE